MNDEFDALVHEAFLAILDFKPDLATYVGLHQYDDNMPSATRKAHTAFVKVLKDYIKKFQEIPAEDLSPTRKIDQKVMGSVLKYHLFEEDKIRRWEKDPDVTEIAGHTIFPLVAREYAPFDKRLESITARLAHYPHYIREFKSSLNSPVHLWVEMAKEACSNFPQFIQAISTAAHQHGLDTAEVDEAAARTVDAISEYAGWLSTVVCEGEPALGEPLFEELLHVRELGMTADEILALGQHYLKKEKQRLNRLQSQLAPSEDTATGSPYTFCDMIDDEKKAIAHVRELVSKKEFATLPENERLIVMETPSFLRHILPGAALFPAAKFEKEQMGIYFVTPPQKDVVKRPDFTSFLNVSVHEAYPGHHLQVVWANQHPSLVRALSQAPEFIEGWAHYCEERMRDYGLNDITSQIMQTSFIVFRAARIIIDVKLHCKKMTVDEAVSFLESEIGMSRSIALIEVKRYTKTPAVPLSYLLGKHLLLQVQKEVKAHMEERYSDKQFHDALLQAGSIPFAYVREELRVKGLL
jgi:uncharacterized protein (DUF885 family)